MRPTASTRSFLTEPLNRLLGTETNVRILRILCRTDTALGRSEVARRAELNDSGVRRALDSLVELGIVEAMSAGVQTVRLRREHYLADSLTDLFASEGRSFEEIIEALRDTSLCVSPPPISAWVEGIAAYGDVAEGGVVLGVVVEEAEVESAAAQLSTGLRRHLEPFDLLVSPRVLTRADVMAGIGPTDDDADVELLVGPHPKDLTTAAPGAARPPGAASGGQESGHATHDRHQLRIASVLADRLLHEPELIERAIRHLEGEVDPDPSVKDPRREWLEILTERSPAAVRRLLLDPGERATRLRQSLPFTAVLSEGEREEILRRANDDQG